MFWAILSAGIILAVILGYISAWWLLVLLLPVGVFLFVLFVLFVLPVFVKAESNTRIPRPRR